MHPSSETINLIKQVLPDELDAANSLLQFQPVPGGSINHCYRVVLDQQNSWFLKLNSNSRYPELLQQEVKGLTALRRRKLIKVSSVISISDDGDQQFLLMEWIKSGPRTRTFWITLGEQLARLHQHSNSEYGWPEDNYCGALTQWNSFDADWISFFISQRINPQLELAVSKNLVTPAMMKQFERLFPRLLFIFDTEKPALLHGDLWSGNLMCNDKSEPVLIDPAVYYGHRSMDLGMTTLFGGFDPVFYESYAANYPLHPDHAEQWEISTLYPLLIHLNLFGIQYLPRIAAILNRYI
ncbi:MAG: fructosamine kinase family protein [Chitinophagaceae bacterium]